MSFAIVAKLLAILAAVGLGWAAGRSKLLGEGDPARVLANAAFYLFVPALLVRTTARLDTQALPWSLLAAFFVPVLGLILLVYLWQRPRRTSAAEPSVKAITAGFGNTLQVGIPLAAGVFGETGLAIHIAVVSLHALVLLILLTLLVELDLAREQPSRSLAATLLQTARNTVIHPVVLPVVVGLSWNATGWPLPAVLDEALQTLGTAVVPLCLTLIGLSLAQYGWPSAWRGMLGLVIVKLLVQPALVLVCAHWGFGLSGLPLAVIVMMGALPIGSNALIFAQRYRALEAETTAATVLSTVAYVATAPLWLALLARYFPWSGGA
jgi:predicted permease